MPTDKLTPAHWTVRPAWTQGARGAVRRCGWHLMCGPEWAQTFALKRDAKAEADNQNGRAALAQQENKRAD